MLLVMIIFVAAVSKLCKVLENSGSHRAHQREPRAPLQWLLTDSSHTTQLFLQLGWLQGAKAPSGLAGFSGWSLCWFSEEERAQVGQPCTHVEAAVANIWL